MAVLIKGRGETRGILMELEMFHVMTTVVDGEPTHVIKQYKHIQLSRSKTGGNESKTGRFVNVNFLAVILYYSFARC